MRTLEDLEDLLRELRAVGLGVGIDERIRLKRIFGLEPALDEAALLDVLAGVLCTSPEEADLLERHYSGWLARAEAGLAAPVPAPGPSGAPRVEATRPSPPQARRNLRPIVWVGLVLVAAALVSYFGARPQDHHPDPLPDASAAPKPGAAEGQQTAPPPTPEPPVEALGALLVGIFGIFLGAGLWTRSRVPVLRAAELPPTRTGPARVPLVGGGRGALLDERDEDTLVWGVGRFVSDELSRALAVRRTVEASAAQLRPVLHYERRRRQREVWLWIDESAETPAMRRLVEELAGVLEAAGLPVERAWFWGVPAQLTLEDQRVVAAAELDERRTEAVVAVLTDGRLLARRAADAHDGPDVRVALRFLSNWPRLAFADFGEGQLAELLRGEDLEVVAPDEVAAFLGEGAARRSEEQAGALRRWAAACALPAEPVDEASAQALRAALALEVSPWAIKALREEAAGPGARLAWGPDARRDLLNWLVATEAPEGALPAQGALAQTLDFWASSLDAEDARRRVDSTAWVDTPAEQRLRVERALLALWRTPAEAVEALWRLHPGPVGPHIEARLAELTARDLPHGGSIALPWTLSAQPVELRLRLAMLGFAREAGLRISATLHRSPRLRFALGLCVGVVAAAGLSLLG